MNLNSNARRRLRDLCRFGAAVSAVMIVATGLSVFDGGARVQAAGTLLGTVTFQDPTSATPVTSGGSGSFALRPPQNAACPGGASETPSYRWQTFFVGSSVDASTLTYLNGPVGPTGAFASSLFDSAQNPVIDRNPSSSPKGLITAIPTMSFKVFVGELKPAPGTYKVGIACTLDGETVSFWEATITIANDAADQPAGIAWTAGGSNPTTTSTSAATTSTTSTTAATTTTTRATTTTVAGATTTTTTVAGATTTTTTLVGATTTTTVAGATTTTALASAAGPVPSSGTPSGGTQFGSSGVPSGSGLPITGPSATVRFILWSLLLLVFGRMAVLLGRPIRVLPYDR